MDFQSWPGLTSKIGNKYLLKSVATVQGHLNQLIKNERSTKVPITMDFSNAETTLVFAAVVDAGNVYSYQTGRFTFTSSRGIKYVFILY